MSADRLYIVADRDGSNEKLVRGKNRTAVRIHVTNVRKPTPEDVARLLQAGVVIQDASNVVDEPASDD